MTVRWALAIEWMLATTLALVLTHLAVEIVGFALLGWALLVTLPLTGGVIGGLPLGVFQWIVLRRHMQADGSWTVFTLLGCFGAWTMGCILAAVAFVPRQGLTQWSAFLCFAIPTPIVGLAQATVLRRWSPHTRVWVLASTAGWTGFVAVEIFRQSALSRVNQLAGALVSWCAGYAAASSVGATLLGGAVAGAITGIALSMAVRRS